MDAGDGLGGADFFGDHRRQHVYLILTRDRHHKISVVAAGFVQDLSIRAVPAERRHVERVGNGPQPIGIGVDDRDVVVRGGEHLCGMTADLSRTADDDSHGWILKASTDQGWLGMDPRGR